MPTLLTENYNFNNTSEIEASSLRRTNKHNSHYLEKPNKLMIQLSLIKEINNSKPQYNRKDLNLNSCKAQKLPQSNPIKSISKSTVVSLDKHEVSDKVSRTPKHKSVKFV